MKLYRISVERLAEIENLVSDKTFSFSKKHDLIDVSEIYNGGESVKIKMAFYLPYEQILKDIKTHDSLPSAAEKESFLHDLCLQYDQHRLVLERRMQDVRRIYNYRNKQK